MEVFVWIITILVGLYLYFKSDESSDESGQKSSRKKFKHDLTPGSERFLPPIPDGFQIYGSCTVAGARYRADNVVEFVDGYNQALEFERDSDNKKDKNAIKVIGISNHDRNFIGFVSKGTAEQIVQSGLYESVLPRLREIFIGDNGYIEISFDLLGKKSEKQIFDGYWDTNPATIEQKNYLKFFGLPIPRSMDRQTADELITKHQDEADEQQKSDWHAFTGICDELAERDFREMYGIKKVPNSLILKTIMSLREQGESISELEDDMDKVVDAILEAKPDLEN